jgi:uncharacterized protein YbjT (DUF2867 family)
MSETVVFGATGAVGSHVLRELVGRGAAVRAFTRDPGRLPGGVEPARGDLDDAATVRAALDGADRVLLCTPNDPRQVERETGVIDAAVAAGVTRLVKISAVVARPGSPSAFADAHGRIEEHLRASGLPSVVLRPGFYMSNLLAAAATIRDTGRFFLPGADAKVAMTDPRDVAAVAAAVLTGDGHEGRTYTVTGPAALTCAEVAVELSAALRRPVEYVGVPDEVARAAMRDAGLPEWLADQVVALWGELRRGAGSATTDVVRVLTGRDPRGVAEFARDHAAAFGRAGTVGVAVNR